MAVVDAVADAVLDRVRPSPEAITLAWAGAGRQEGDPRVARTGPLVRLAGPADTRLAEQVTIMPANTRRELAAVILSEAVRLASDPEAGLIERVVARQIAYRVRGDLQDRTGLTAGQRAGPRPGEAGRPDRRTRGGRRGPGRAAPAAVGAGERQKLLTAMLRLASPGPGQGTTRTR